MKKEIEPIINQIEKKTEKGYALRTQLPNKRAIARENYKCNKKCL